MPRYMFHPALVQFLCLRDAYHGLSPGKRLIKVIYDVVRGRQWSRITKHTLERRDVA
jgi:hypothetical protein